MPLIDVIQQRLVILGQERGLDLDGLTFALRPSHRAHEGRAALTGPFPQPRLDARSAGEEIMVQDLEVGEELGLVVHFGHFGHHELDFAGVRLELVADVDAGPTHHDVHQMFQLHQQ